MIHYSYAVMESGDMYRYLCQSSVSRVAIRGPL